MSKSVHFVCTNHELCVIVYREPALFPCIVWTNHGCVEGSICCRQLLVWQRFMSADLQVNSVSCSRFAPEFNEWSHVQWLAFVWIPDTLIHSLFLSSFIYSFIHSFIMWLVQYAQFIHIKQQRKTLESQNSICALVGSSLIIIFIYL